MILRKGRPGRMGKRKEKIAHFTFRSKLRLRTQSVQTHVRSCFGFFFLFGPTSSFYYRYATARHSTTAIYSVRSPTRFKRKLSSDGALQPVILVRDSHLPIWHWCREGSQTASQFSSCWLLLRTSRTPRSIALHLVSRPRFEDARWSDARPYSLACLRHFILLFFFPFIFIFYLFISWVFVPTSS